VIRIAEPCYIHQNNSGGLDPHPSGRQDGQGMVVFDPGETSPVNGNFNPGSGLNPAQPVPFELQIPVAWVFEPALTSRPQCCRQARARHLQ
jgi:hypothetical protein